MFGLSYVCFANVINWPPDDLQTMSLLVHLSHAQDFGCLAFSYLRNKHHGCELL
jgi:hypothetical protein